MRGLASSCGACKFLRRRCASDCIFAPYFCHEQASTHFSAVHKVFGASNVSKLLLHMPVDSRGDAAITISYEALARIRDPVYGCVAHIFALQQQVANLQEEIYFLENYIASHTIDFTNNGVFQATNNDQRHPCNQSYCSPPPPPPPPLSDDMDTFYYQNQNQNPEVSTELPTNLGNSTNVSQAFNGQMNVSEVSNSLQGSQDHQSSVSDSSISHILGLLEGEDEETLAYYSWLDIVSGTNIATI